MKMLLIQLFDRLVKTLEMLNDSNEEKKCLDFTV